MWLLCVTKKNAVQNHSVTLQHETYYTTVMSQNGKLEIKDNLIQMFDGAGTLRFNAGYSESLGKYVFELYNADGKQTACIDDNGNLTICGIFKTGFDGEARTIIDGNGIQSYDKNGAADGFFANYTPDGFGVHMIALYDNGNDIFRVYKGIGNQTFITLNGNIFLMSNGNTVNFGQTLQYEGYEIATQKDISDLQSQIKSLKDNVNPVG